MALVITEPIPIGRNAGKASSAYLGKLESHSLESSKPAASAAGS